MWGIIWTLIIGGLVGWAAQAIMSKDVPGGVIGNIIVGFIGAALGGFLIPESLSLGLYVGGFAIIPAVIGSVLIVLIFDLIF